MLPSSGIFVLHISLSFLSLCLGQFWKALPDPLLFVVCAKKRPRLIIVIIYKDQDPTVTFYSPSALSNSFIHLKFPRAGKHSLWGLRMFCILFFWAQLHCYVKSALAEPIYKNTVISPPQACRRSGQAGARRRVKTKIQERLCIGSSVRVPWVLQHLFKVRHVNTPTEVTGAICGLRGWTRIKHPPDLWLELIRSPKQSLLFNTALSSPLHDDPICSGT